MASDEVVVVVDVVIDVDGVPKVVLAGAAVVAAVLLLAVEAAAAVLLVAVEGAEAEAPKLNPPVVASAAVVEGAPNKVEGAAAAPDGAAAAAGGVPKVKPILLYRYEWSIVACL